MKNKSTIKPLISGSIIEIGNSLLSDFNYKRDLNKVDLSWKKVFDSVKPAYRNSFIPKRLYSKNNLSLDLKKSPDFIILSFNKFDYNTTKEIMYSNYFEPIDYLEFLQKETKYLKKAPIIIILTEPNDYKSSLLTKSIRIGIKHYINLLHKSSSLELAFMNATKLPKYLKFYYERKKPKRS